MKSVAKSDVDDHKQWAWDIMDQQAFEKEFIKRNPHAGGVIPIRAEWIKTRASTGQAISKFNPDELVIEQVIKKEEPKKNWDCPGCGKEFKKNHVGRRKHMTHCKEFMNMRTVH